MVIREAPRVEKLVVPPGLLVSCPRASVGAPEPETATFLDVARFLVTLAARNDACAGQVDELRGLLAPVP